MPVKVRCPECEKVLTVPDEARGKAVKCPACSGRVPVPRGQKSSGPKRQKAAAGAAKTRKPARSAAPEDEDALFANLDLSRAEDRSTRVCPRCGIQVDEEDIECPKCGVDLVTGRLSAEKLAKKERGGPDPDKYYEKFLSDGWEFLKKHWGFGMRTMVYVMITTVICGAAAFMMIYTSKLPLKAFWGVIALLLAMVGPGWCWFLDTVLIQSTFDKKIKLDRVRYEFFTSAALGIKFVSWLIVFSAPFQIVFGTVGGILIANDNAVVGLVLIALGFLPAFFCFPVAMSHMAMPVQWPGWLSPKILPQYFKGLVKPAMYWCLFCGATMLPSLILVSIIPLAFGSDLSKLVEDLNHNARVQLVMSYEEPKKKNAAGEQEKELPGQITTELNPVSWWLFATKDQILSERKYYADQSGGGEGGIATGGTAAKKPWEREIDMEPVIVPSILWLLACAPFAFAAVFNMRTNALFTYYFQPELALIREEKEVKWDPKKRRDDEFDEGGGGFDDEDNLSTGEVLCGVILSGIGLILGIVWAIQGKPKGAKMIAVALIADLIKGGIFYALNGGGE